MARAILIDRDGTLCEDVGHLDRIERLRLIEGGAEAIRRANAAGLRAVLVTNQSGVGRGYFDERALDRIHAHLRRLLAERGARLDRIYHCPHHPEAARPSYRRVCACRKPAPGMLLRARDELGLALERSYTIGDRMRDLEAGARAGTRTILVLSGRGREEFGYHSSACGPRADFVARNLLDAVEWILEREPTERLGPAAPAEQR